MPRYREGDVIFRSEPWVYCVLESASTSICYRCLRQPDEGVRRCTQCQFAHYCSDQCQKSDWTLRHRPECKVIQRIMREKPSESLPRDFLFILCKMIPKLKKNHKSDSDGACQPLSVRTFEDLMSHEQEFSQNPALPVLYASWKPYLDLLDKGSSVCPDVDAFIRLYGKFNINAFSLADYFLGDTGKGLYLGPSILDHSCIPNAVQIFQGTTLTVKAIQDIEKEEDVRIAYISTFATTRFRREYLKQHYFFICDCAACVNVELDAKRSAVQCTTERCPAVVPLDEKVRFCNECGADNLERLLSGRKHLERMWSDHDRIVEGSERFSYEEILKVLQQDISAAEKLLHCTNFLMGIFYREAAVALENLGRYDESVRYLQKALPAMRMHLSKYQSEVTGALSETMYWLGDNQQFSDALRVGTELQDILRIVPGENTEIYEEYSKFLLECQTMESSMMTSNAHKLNHYWPYLDLLRLGIVPCVCQSVEPFECFVIQFGGTMAGNMDDEMRRFEMELSGGSSQNSLRPNIGRAVPPGFPMGPSVASAPVRFIPHQLQMSRASLHAAPVPAPRPPHAQHFTAPQAPPFFPPMPMPPMMAPPMFPRMNTPSAQPSTSQARQAVPSNVLQVSANKAMLDAQKAMAMQTKEPPVMGPQITPKAIEDKALSNKSKKKMKFTRTAGGEVWEDSSLAEWDPHDYRIFCGDLGNEVNDEALARAFRRYASFQKAKVIRDKRTNKTKGFGFVSFKNPEDFVRAMKEMNGKYVGNRPIKLRKSSWKDRQLDVAKKRFKEKQKSGMRG
ncbi:uncharacterized protein LOC129580742 [Paramacrobiotus metropolitanus]|uniref:uncharacterized protein LOC129580742 n=1 Tax=Paramacrobiotus metropolitanus TaxID=2943436 RepID=UPI00244577F9|nr:uncharacterized protein LOC129580742 [Paramacrobiotus metropolitanus]